MKKIEVAYDIPKLWDGSFVTIDDSAYAIIGPDDFSKVIISAFDCVLYFPDESSTFNLIPRIARIDKFLFTNYFEDQYIEPGYIRLNRLVKTKKEAIRLTKFYPVKMNEKEWVKITGVRDDRTNIDEDCELTVCCAAISHIRDLLLKCKEKGGLIQYDIELIKIEMKSCFPTGGINLLGKVLDQLAIESIS